MYIYLNKKISLQLVLQSKLFGSINFDLKLNEGIIHDELLNI